MKRHKLALILVVLAAFTAPSLAHATFQLAYFDESVPNEFKLFLDQTQNTTLLSGNVGGQNGSPITITPNAAVDVAGSGWATIQDVPRSDVSVIRFTPADATHYNDFSFRAQLASEGSIGIRGLSNDGAFDFLIPDLDDNELLTRMGILSTDGEWLQYVEIYTDTFFNQVKQIEFSQGEGPEPVPEPGTVMLLGMGFLGLAVFAKRRTNA